MIKRKNNNSKLGNIFYLYLIKLKINKKKFYNLKIKMSLQYNYITLSLITCKTLLS